jgi:hypothetical protein
MIWTSVSDSLPEEGVECLLSCMRPGGTLVELIGYLQNGKWVLEGDYPDITVRYWSLFAAQRKII